MVLKDILSISGESGLFKFIAQGKNAVIIEHLETGKRSTAFASAKVSSLEDISIFTQEGDLPLAKLFDAMFEKHAGAMCDVQIGDGKALKNYFGEVLPDYDSERVYVSDMKKIILWYNLLHKLNLLVKEEEEAEAGEKEEKVAKVKKTTKEGSARKSSSEGTKKKPAKKK